ncbi:MAG: hypothetical protein PHT36_02215 [Patescibacteria group bacterium]|nr:hypothetical protein [Patescibacteria group bacterium]
MRDVGRSKEFAAISGWPTGLRGSLGLHVSNGYRACSRWTDRESDALARLYSSVALYSWLLHDR